MTVRHAHARLTELGFTKADANVDELFNLDASLTEECGATVPDAITTLMVALDAAIAIDGHDYGSDSEDYEEAFAMITECAGTGLDITDVAFDDEHHLHFVANGTHRTWQPELADDGKIDVMCFIESISDFTPSDSRRWASIHNDDVMAASFVLGEPSALDRLSTEFGLDLHIH